METMQAEYWKQNYVMSNTVSCDRTDGEIPAGIFMSLWYLTPNSCNCRCIRVLQPDAHKHALLYDAACASAVCPRPAIPGSPA